MKIIPTIRTITKDRCWEHLVWWTELHRIDRENADRIRTRKYALIDIEEMPIREAFPEDRKLAFMAVANLKSVGQWSYATKEVFKKTLKTAAKDANMYFKDTGKKNKDGTHILQKRKTEGLYDVYFNLPPWISLNLAKLVEEGESGNDTFKITMAKLGVALSRELEKRSGYKAVSFAFHPDSRNKVGFHLQFQTVSDKKLLGRSTNGKKGRKGLRVMGDVNLAMYRMNKLDKITTDRHGEPLLQKDIATRFERKNYDDIAFDSILNDFIDKNLPKQVVNKIKNDGVEYAKNWNAKRVEAVANSPKALKAELERIKGLSASNAKAWGTAQKEIRTLKEAPEKLKEQLDSLNEKAIQDAARITDLERQLKELKKKKGVSGNEDMEM